MRIAAACIVLASAAPARADKPIDTRLHAGLLSAREVASLCASNGRPIARKAFEARVLEVLPGARRDGAVEVEVPTRDGKASCGAEFAELTVGDERWVRVTAPLGIDDAMDVIVRGHVSAIPKVLGSWAPYLHGWCVGPDGMTRRRALGMSHAQFLALPPQARKFACHDFDPPETE